MIADRINAGLRRVPPWSLYVAGALWAAWLFFIGVTNPPTPEPINWLEREYGNLALKLLVVGLAVTPLRRHLRINLMPFRRAIGVTAFFFVLAHFLVFAILDVQSVARVWTEIVKRPYVTVGMASFLLLIPLGATSNNASIRRIGAATWRKLHKLVYPAAILAAIHYLWLSKGFQIEPLVYLALILALLTFRLPWKRLRPAT